MASSFTDLLEEARLSARALLDYGEHFFNPTVRLGVTGLSRAGKTVFISSHVLSEVQQICTRVAIINHGKLVRVAPVAELLDSPGEFEIKVDAPDALIAALKLQAWGGEARVEHGLVITRAPDGRGRNLIAYLVQNGHNPDSVSERQRDLEDIFLSLTGGDS